MTFQRGIPNMLPKYNLIPGLLAVLLLAQLTALAQVRVTAIRPGDTSMALQWEGGNGPFVLETSQDLHRWSDVGEPLAGNTGTLSAPDGAAFYRVADLDPAGLHGRFLGLLQTDQGEFGSLMARHRLKTRLWLYLSKDASSSPTPYTPAASWRKLIIYRQHLENGTVQTSAGTLEELGAVATPSAQRLTVTWKTGNGPDGATFVLTLDFPYSIQATRSLDPLASDPTYSLKCTYATAQPELDLGTATFKKTNVDTVGLIQLDPANNPANPDQSYRVRKYRVSQNAVHVDLHFLEGIYLVQGKPPFILKTFPLDRWLAPTTAAGDPLPTFTTDSYFARTLLPGHHNFLAVVLVEPALDPLISEEVRAALIRANVRQIYTFKDLANVTIGGDSEDIRLIGYDNSVRQP